MNAIIIVIIVTTIVQLFACHLSLWWLLCVIGRIIFSLRMIGATVKVKYSCILEGVAIAAMLLYNMLFHKGNIHWVRILLFIVFSAISCACQVLDDMLYVYEIDDDDDY